MDGRQGKIGGQSNSKLLFVLAASTAVLTSVPAHAQGRCSDEGSQQIADKVREAVPDSVAPQERRIERNRYLVTHKWELIDQNGDGKIDFKEYLAGEWAGYLVQSSPGSCVITRDEFMQRFLGFPSDPASGWRTPSQIALMSDFFKGQDRGRKGYLTEDDIRARTERSFQFSDKNHDGVLTPDEWR